MKIHDFSSKLGPYSAMAASFIALQNGADAQTAYTDLIPDKILTSTGPNDTLHLDVDGDNFTDFVFNASFSYSSYASADNYYNIGIKGLNGDRIAFSVQTQNVYTFFNAVFTNVTQNMVKAFPTGAQINGVNNFIGYAPVFKLDCFPAMYSSVSDYCWNLGFPNNTVKNIGFRLKNGTLKYYGWMRVVVNDVPATYTHPTSITILDFAVNLTSGATVLAGVVPIIIEPGGLGTGWLATTQAKLIWDPVEYVQQYEVQYRQADGAGGPWTTVMVPGTKTSVKLTGLTCNTPYEWQIRSKFVDAGISSFSETQSFTTMECRMGTVDGLEMPELTVYAYADQLTIHADGMMPENAQIDVIDQLGQVVFNTAFNGDHAVYDLSIPNGIYTAIIHTDHDRQVHRFVIQH